MNRLVFAGIILTICCHALVCSSQPKGVSIAKKSAWIQSIEYDVQARPKARDASSYYYLLTDDQENTSTQEKYEHYAYAILTSEGIQELADLSFDFEPTYQQLTIHEVKIIRNGTTINQLTNDIQVIQREQSLEFKLYDGTKTAIVNLKDVRVGDVIEYSFTLKGYNPVHEGHIARTYSTDSYESVDKAFRRITIPETHKVTVKSLGDDVRQPQVKHQGGMVDYSWTRLKTVAKEFDFQTPSGMSKPNMVMISDFESWAEVGAWAKKLFELPTEEREKIKKVAAQEFTANDDEEYVLSVVRFVQDNVRYLGFETGINTHKPYPPAQVFEQRFGDCKDKSLLLVTLLQARGIEAYPVLVNTSMKNQIDDRLPAGILFDHCVVQFILNDRTIYIDPTISNQGGTPYTIHFPDYRRGLVLDKAVTGLDELPEPAKPSTTEVHTFDVPSMAGEALMSVHTIYTGSDADYQRSSFAQSALESLQKNFKEYYANMYPDIEVWDPLTFKDDRVRNIFTVDERYRLPSFWKQSPDQENKLVATTQPLSVTGYFDVPKKIVERKSPYYLSYPLDITHTIILNMPEYFGITPEEKTIETDSYFYEYVLQSKGNQITKITRYETKKDHVPTEEIKKYVADHERMSSELVFQLTYDKDIAAASKNNLPGVLTFMAALATGVFLCLYLYYRYDPAPARYMVRGLPIGGWLVLMAFGLVLGPIVIIILLFTTPDAITGTSWLTYFAAENYGIFAYLLFSQVYNIAKLLFVAMLALLFFQRRSSFPRLMQIFCIVHVIVVTLDTAVARSLADNPDSVSVKDAFQAFFYAAVWVPYLAISQRVKDTFVIRGPNHEEDDGDETNEKEAMVGVGEDLSSGSQFAQ